MGKHSIGPIITIIAILIACGVSISATTLNNNTKTPTTPSTVPTPAVKDGVYEETERVVVDYKTVTVDDNSMELGTTETRTSGVKGIKKITYKVTYENDKEIAREKIKEEVISRPVDEVIAKGTKNTWHCVDTTSYDRNPNNDNKCTSSKGEVRYVNDSTACSLDKSYRPGQAGAYRYNSMCNY